jgi:hypothetical protein
MSTRIYNNSNGPDQQNMGVLRYNTHHLDTDKIFQRLRNEICDIGANCQNDIRESSSGGGYIGIRNRQFDIQIVYISPEDDQFNNIITLSKSELPKLISVLQSI